MKKKCTETVFLNDKYLIVKILNLKGFRKYEDIVNFDNEKSIELLTKMLDGSFVFLKLNKSTDKFEPYCGLYLGYNNKCKIFKSIIDDNKIDGTSFFKKNQDIIDYFKVMYPYITYLQDYLSYSKKSYNDIIVLEKDDDYIISDGWRITYADDVKDTPFKDTFIIEKDMLYYIFDGHSILTDGFEYINDFNKDYAIVEMNCYTEFNLIDKCGKSMLDKNSSDIRHIKDNEYEISYKKDFSKDLSENIY